MSYRQQFVEKAQSMISKVIEYKMISLHLERVADIALTTPEQDSISDAIIPHTINGEIKINNLAFRYSEHDPYIFKT